LTHYRRAAGLDNAEPTMSTIARPRHAEGRFIRVDERVIARALAQRAAASS
jgi:hypothetical protein